MEADGQVGASRTFRHVDDTWARGGWRDSPRLPQDWALRRFEGTIREIADWWNLSDPRTNYVALPGGEYAFRPGPGARAALDEWAIRAGCRPAVVMATSTVPAPLVEGGIREGQYGYNIRHPSDYPKWQRYIESALRWLVGEYGRDRVRTWTYILGIEADWQSKAVIPGTQTDMPARENRRAYMRLLDHFQAACENVLGPTAYVGIYFAFETQIDDYARHWASETNYATGRKGTPLGFVGFSDWTLVGIDEKNPFSLSGQHRRAAQGFAETEGAFASGLVWKYHYVAGRMAAAGLPSQMEVGLPEAGYFDVRGATNAAGAPTPCDVILADHRGAALRALRAVAYAACPRIRWAWNRYALGAGDYAGIYADETKPPMFHAIRLQKMLEGERMLSVRAAGAPADPANDLRVIASSADDAAGSRRIIAVNFSESLHAKGAERARVRITGLGDVRQVIVTEYRIDETHNNWWTEWRALREARGIPYVAGRNSGHLGAGLKYGPEIAPLHADVVGTLPAEGAALWQTQSALYHRRDGLAPTGSRTVEARGGVVELDLRLEANSVLYLRVCGGGAVPRALALPGERGASGWSGAGRWRAGAGGVRLLPGLAGATLRRRISGLAPGRLHTVLCEAAADGRVMDYRLTAGAPGRPEDARGDWSARANRLAVTVRSSVSGTLDVALRAPGQRCEAGDGITFSRLRVVAH